MFGTSILVQRCRDINKNVYIEFIDYKEAFDRVKHDRLIQILDDLQLAGQDINIIVNLN